MRALYASGMTKFSCKNLEHIPTKSNRETKDTFQEHLYHRVHQMIQQNEMQFANDACFPFTIQRKIYHISLPKLYGVNTQKHTESPRLAKHVCRAIRHWDYNKVPHHHQAPTVYPVVTLNVIGSVTVISHFWANEEQVNQTVVAGQQGKRESVVISDTTVVW